MARLFRGKKATMPRFSEGVIGFTTDTKEVFIGTSEGNYPITHNADFHSGSYTIPGESTVLYRIQKKNNDPFTVVEIAAPESSKGGDSESTIALIREEDSETGCPEFLDIYNNGYWDSRQMGLRVQTRGGLIRDLVFDFFDGTNRGEYMRMKPNRVSILNHATSCTFDMKPDGNTVHYQPVGDYYFYLDVGQVFINDIPVQLLRKGTTAQRPTGGVRVIGLQYYDTTLLKPIWWNGTVWKDAVGTTV